MSRQWTIVIPCSKKYITIKRSSVLFKCDSCEKSFTQVIWESILKIFIEIVKMRKVFAGNYFPIDQVSFSVK